MPGIFVSTECDSCDLLLCIAAQTECHDRECSCDVHAGLAARHRDGDFHGRLGHDFGSDAEFFVTENDETFFRPCYVIYTWDVFTGFESDNFVAIFLMPFDAIERTFPTLDGNPFLTPARGAFYGYMIGIAAVAA